MKFNFDICKIEASKHFVIKYMKKWDWDFTDLREALKHSHEIKKVGNKKYEAYTKKKGSKKMIFVHYSEFNAIFVITGSEGD